MQQFIKHFRRDGQGCWTCFEAATLDTPVGRIQVTPGSRFMKGTKFMNFDVAEMLEAERAKRHPA